MFLDVCYKSKLGVAPCTFGLGRGRFSSKLEIIQGYTVSPFLKKGREKKRAENNEATPLS